MKYTRSGFTLIELLIVIAILGLVSTFLIVSLKNARSAANNGAAQSIARDVVTLAEIKRAEQADAVQYTSTVECLNHVISSLPNSVVECKIKQDSNTSYALVRSSSGSYFYFDGSRLNGPLNEPPLTWQ